MRQSLLRLLLFLIVILIVFGVYRLLTIEPLQPVQFFHGEEGPPLMLVDPGSATDVLSYSPAALSAASEAGTDGLALSVYLTRDGELVVLPGRNIGDADVTELRLQELRAIGGADTSQIMTLDETLGAFPNQRVVVTVAEPSLASLAALFQAAERTGARDRLLVVVDDQEFAEALRRQAPDLATAYTSQEAAAFLPTHRMGLTPFYRPPAPVLVLPGQQVTDSLVRSAHSRGVQVVVDARGGDASEVQRWLGLDVDGIIVRSGQQAVQRPGGPPQIAGPGFAYPGG